MKKLQPKFSNFNYRIVESTLDYHHEVEVTYDYGKTQAKRILYIPTLENQPDSYYIERAKEKIADEIENGSLIKYTTKNFGNRPSSKTALKAAVWVLAIATLASTGYLIYRALPFNNRHRITFVSNGGSDVASQYVVDGEKLAKPVNPTREGYPFESWYLDKEFSNEYVFDAPVKRDLVLYAKWGKIYTYEVAFEDPEGGLSEDMNPLEVSYGTKWSDIKDQLLVEAQEKAQSEDWIIHEFTNDQDETIDPNFEIKDNLELHAHWDVKVYFADPIETMPGYKYSKHGHLPRIGDLTFTASALWGDVESSCQPEMDDNYAFNGFAYQDSSWKPVDKTKPVYAYVGKTLYPSYGVKSISFQEDPWEVLIDAFNNNVSSPKTLDDWAEGDPYYEDYLANDSTFVGLERKVKYGGKIYTARVIDEDRTVTIGRTRNPFLTFEFEEVIGETIYNDYVDNEICNVYAGSVLENYLNDTVYNGLKTSEPELQAAIKPTEKTYIDPHNITIPSTTVNYLFALSGSEIYGSGPGYDYPKDSDDKEVTPILDEGDTYAYYVGKDKSARVKYFVDDIEHEGPGAPYWLRSPKENNGAYAWAVNTDGEIGILESDEESGLEIYSTDIETVLYVAPAFMI